MIACAEWLGRSSDTCTRGKFCVCKNLAMREVDCNDDDSQRESQRTLMPPDTSNRVNKEKAMDELVKRLRSLKVLLGTDSPEVRGWSSAVQQAAQKTVNDAIAALSAQPQQEPVAWEWKCVYDMGKWSVVRVADGFKLWGPIEQFEATLLINKLHSLAPLYTALPSGVREGMLRAAEIAGKIKLDRASILHERKMHGLAGQAFDTGWAIEEAITRTADQVNAEGQKIDKAALDEYQRKVDRGYVFKPRG